MNVMVCTMFSPAYRELEDITLPNLLEYTERHGYAVTVIKVEDEKWAYKKHEHFKEIFEKMPQIDLIWYKDVDALITNPTILITDFIGEQDIYITKDFNELNGGSLIIKNTKLGRSINDLIINQRKDFENEQNAMNFWFPKIEGSVIKILPQNTINSYRYDLYPECKEYAGRNDLGDWREGDFVLHTPGLGLKQRAEILKNTPIVRCNTTLSV